MKKINSTAIVLNIENIDTDQIIPAKFLKSTNRDGFGKHLFSNWRYDDEGNPKEDFAFNQFESESEILIAGNNFGCGSSREHAAWAIADYGIKVIISSQFADIFKGNALNNGVLPVEVSQDSLRVMMKYFSKHKSVKIQIDLENQVLKAVDQDIVLHINFDIDPLKKQFLMEGISDIEYLIKQEKEISKFESTHKL
ncbi:MAG: 3-isopropylmalate dehydratase small subunit [Crocinitomicaceae bacterium]|nr:3-isopropylmalate dehydratase small subunit [Crocinitomicaceae bacterium]